MDIITLKREWYVLLTKSRFETVVFDALTKKRKEVFLPKIRVRSKRRDRKVMLNSPLFPGYLFVKTDLEPHDHLDILKTTGAVRLIGNTKDPVPVSEDSVASLKIMVSVDNSISTGTRFSPGDRVMVIAGPFAGVIGIFSKYKGQGRVIVNIDILGQYASVDADVADVEKLPKILS